MSAARTRYGHITKLERINSSIEIEAIVADMVELGSDLDLLERQFVQLTEESGDAAPGVSPTALHVQDPRDRRVAHEGSDH